VVDVDQIQIEEEGVGRDSEGSIKTDKSMEDYDKY